jgi:hypothetical protein
MGSVNAVNKESVASPASAIDTLESLTAAKRQSQCSPMIAPTASYFATFLHPSQILRCRVIKTQSKAPATASTQRHVTSTGALTEARRPRMVVAAKITTSRCSWTKTLMPDARDPCPVMEAK